MFGYINIDQKIMTEENKKAYQSYYCGLCRKLKSDCGTKGQMLLTYDMTFLVVLLTGLYELSNEESEITCALHPTKKRTVWINEATQYAADMNLVLAYQNLIDDWKDDKAYTKKALAKMLDKDYTRIMSKYPRQVKALEDYMRRTEEVERSHESNLDVVAGLTGEMLGEIFCWKEDEWAEELRTLGFYMGKFIYLMDAYFVNYWMTITLGGRYGFHDADGWRTPEEYGGDTYLTNGSGGCINVPGEKISIMYDLVPDTTPVVIYNEFYYD